MQIFDFEELEASGLKKDKRTVIAIGVFDGLHKGHQKILRRVAESRRENPGSESMVITFNTNPKKKGVKSIDTMRLRSEFVSSYGIDSFVVIDFSVKFSKISASGFVSALLSMTNPYEIVVGNDFKFGHPDDQGTADTMESIFASQGADVHVSKVDFVLSEEGEKISSTGLRDLIKNGRIEEYFNEVGRSYLLDLEMMSSSRSQDKSVWEKDTIHQLLPPEGVYDGLLRSGNGTPCACLIDISQELLSIVKIGKESGFGSGAGGAEASQPENTLLFLRRSSK